MKLPQVLQPLHRRNFRLLWAGMGASYAGDRLQEMAEAWLVAVLTQASALAVGAISVIAAIPQLFMPLGGALAERVDRRLNSIAETGIMMTTAAAGSLLLERAGWQLHFG